MGPLESAFRRAVQGSEVGTVANASSTSTSSPAEAANEETSNMSDVEYQDEVEIAHGYSSKRAMLRQFVSNILAVPDWSESYKSRDGSSS